MDKKAIEKFAIEARKLLIEQASQRAAYYGITAKNICEEEQESSDGIVIDGKVHNKEIRDQRRKLVQQIVSKGFDTVMEEIAYTWFNRFIALRFMEVNDYLPTNVRVFSSHDLEKKQPDILTHALEVDLPFDKEEIYRLQQEHKDDELYKRLIIAQCNALHKSLPFLFEEVKGYSELLFPSNLLFAGSVTRRMVEDIPEEDWREVEIVGWLYQYYISERKDEAIKAKKKYRNDQIPVVTQLFTPKWLVQYMVDNSLGRAWLEANSQSKLSSAMEYYIKPNDDSVASKKILKNVNPEEVTFFDPACGSGHILVYAFDLLYEIYLEKGYDKRDVPKMILEKNLFGLDIDDRAIQLTCFTLMMKARSKSRRILSEEINLNILAFENSEGIESFEIAYTQLLEDFQHGKVLGSLIQPQTNYHGSLFDQPEFVDDSLSLLDDFSKPALNHLMKLSEFLTTKYHIVVTNPPYIGGKYLNTLLGDYVKKHYPNTKADLFAAFSERMFSFVKEDGYIGLVTPFVWMFIQSYEWMRKHIIDNSSIISLVKPEYHFFFDSAFVPLVSFVLKKSKQEDLAGEFFDLSHVRTYDEHISAFKEAIQNPSVSYRYSTVTSDFQKIPGSPIAYWVSNAVREIFQKESPIHKVATPRAGMITGNNELFLRAWHEINENDLGIGFNSKEEAKLSGKKWFPYLKGGSFRKWYGNLEYVVNWQNDGFSIKNTKDKNGKIPAHAFNDDYIFKANVNWSSVSSSDFSVRFIECGCLFDAGGSAAFSDVNTVKILLSFLNTDVTKSFLQAINPTLNFQAWNIGNLPLKTVSDKIKNTIIPIIENNISISKYDWNSFETSWDFETHPLLKHKEDSSLKNSFDKWNKFSEQQFQQLKSNEEELNRIFIDIYGLQDELTPDVPDEEITIRNADRERDIKSFISYAVGCMFGRYSLDQEGLAYAGGEFDISKYSTFPADDDNIIPILDADYFEDDIVSRFVEFMKVSFGEASLQENLQYIAATFGQKSNENPVEAIRRYFVGQFYKDHTQVYKKRPIYWLFTSGKQKAFNALIYMHRYDKSTLSRMRTDYLHEHQGKIEIRLQQLNQTTENANARDKSNAQKEITRLKKQQEELRKYDELLRHYADMQIEIDLDDGVKVNYAKFQELTAKI